MGKTFILTNINPSRSGDGTRYTAVEEKYLMKCKLLIFLKK